MDIDYSGYILAAAALGTAAAGVVETIKINPIKEIGFSKIVDALTAPILDTLRNVYGEAYRDYLKSLYRENRREGKLKSLLRQGFRIALTRQTAALFAKLLPTLDADKLADVAAAIQEGRTLSTEESTLLGRFEVAMDARIDSALAAADELYTWSMRGLASIVAVVISIAVAVFEAAPNAKPGIGLAIVIGLAAVPLAPVANDLVAGINAARKALESRR